MIQCISKQISSEFIGERRIRLDLVVRSSDGEFLNIVLRKQMDSSIEESKMQKRNDDALCKQIVDSSEATKMYKRSLYYLAKLYSSQLQRGDEYNKLCPVITINILDFNLFYDNTCDRSFVLKNTKTNEEYLRMIEMHFVELSNS